MATSIYPNLYPSIYPTAVVGPVVTGASPPGGVKSVAYSQVAATVTSGTAPYVSTALASGALPPGLSLSISGSNVILSGTPTAIGNYTFTVSVTDTASATGTSFNIMVSITAAVVAPSGIGTLPGNLLSYINQSFQTGVGSWTTSTGAATLTTSTAQIFEGAASAKWTATGALSSVISAAIPVRAGQPYIVSGYIYLPNPGGTVSTAMRWSTGATTSGATLSVPAGWSPVIASGIAPSGATTAQITMTAGSVSGASVFMGLVYFAQSEVQVVADWINPPFFTGSIAGNAFSDLTPFVQSQEATIVMTHGRQDAVAEVQNGTLQFQCDNLQGWFTPGNSNSPWLPSLGARVQVNVSYATASGTASTTWTAFQVRFDGSINEFDFEIDSIAGHPQVQVNARDVLGALSNQDALSCWTKEQILLDGPFRHWTLDDTNGLTQAQETSGFGGSPLVQRQLGTQCTGAFASGQNAVETQQDTPVNTTLIPGPWSTSTLNSYYSSQSSHTSTGTASNNSAPLVGSIPWLYLNGQTFDPVSGASTSAGWSFEIIATPDPGAGATAWSSSNIARLNILSLTATYWGRLDLWCEVPTAKIRGSLTAGDPTSPPPAIWSSAFYPTNAWNATNPQPIHLLWTCTTGSVLTLYVNGVAETSTTIPSQQQNMGFNGVVVGDTGDITGPSGWSGNLSLVSAYNYALSSGQAILHSRIARYGLAQVQSGEVIEFLAQYANLPQFWMSNTFGTDGLTYLDYFDITGSNPLAAMQQAEAGEAGLLYTTTAGVLQFAGRDVRMGAGSGTLTLPEGSFDAKLGHKVTDQYVQTSAAVAGSAFGDSLATRASLTSNSTANVSTGTVAGVAAVSFNTAALRKLGQYPNGDVTAPTTVPVQTIAQALPALASVLPYAQDIADWNVNRNDMPPFKATTLTVNVLTMTYPSSPTWLAPAVVASQDINSVLTINVASSSVSFPNGLGDLDLFVEGVTEEIGTSVHTIGFYTSPANSQRCWVPGDSVLGVLDETAVIGIALESVKPSYLANRATDPGGPWLAPSYSTTMNKNQGASGYVGASDQRGIWYNLQQSFSPPVFVGQSGSLPAITSNSWQHLALTYINIDNRHGWNPSVPIAPSAVGGGYVCQLGGFYELCGLMEVPGMSTNSDVFISAVVYDPRTGLTWNAAGANSGASRNQATWSPQMRNRFFMGPGAVVSFWMFHNSTLGPLTPERPILSLEFIGFSYVPD